MGRHTCVDCRRRWSDQQKSRGDCPYCGAAPIGRGRGRSRKPEPHQRPPGAIGKTTTSTGKPTPEPVRKVKVLPRGISSQQQRWREQFATRTGYRPRPDGSIGVDNYWDAEAA